MNQSGLYCPKCGQLNEAAARFCRYCGSSQPQTGPEPQADSSGHASSALHPDLAWRVPAPQAPPSVENQDVTGYAPGVPHYAGFWIRLVALMIDGAVLAIPSWVLIGGLIGASVGVTGIHRGRTPDPGRMIMLLPVFGMVWLAILVGSWLYEALLTGSSKQGTLGKMALGLKVTDRHGRRLSFAHATGRHFAKLINGFTLGIGWLIAGFTERKQGLHDFIAGTCVIRANH